MAFLVLEVLSGLEIDGVSQIFTLFKNVADGGRTPAVHIFESLVLFTPSVLGVRIRQHQQKRQPKFYTLPRAKASRFPEKSSEKRLKMPWVKVQVHRICQSPFWHLFVTPLKMGAKKPESRSVSLHRDTNCHPPARERSYPLPHSFCCLMPGIE